MRTPGTAGFSMVETLVGMVVMLLVMTGVATMLMQSSKLNKKERMTVQVQADARNCLSMIVAKLRSAGWDPTGIGFDSVTTDPDPGDGISQIEVRADLNDDGDIDDDFEQLLIRHVGGRVEWRPQVDDDFATLAINISNDADGDGNAESMFVSDGKSPPERIIVQVTARSAWPDPATKEFIRYTVSSAVALRGNEDT